MTDVDRQVARSAELLARTDSRNRRGLARQHRTQALGRRLTRIAVADAAILVATIVIGLVVGPIGLIARSR